MADSQKGLYILLFSIHGLVRSRNIEMGRNADTGGQVKYVLELAEHLSQRSEVARVDLFTRQIRDKQFSEDYSQPVEPISEKARIVRIPCGGGRYIRKELLWPHLDEFIDKTLKFIKRENLDPYLIHGHYADAGYVAMHLASLYGVPFVFTGHSLGKVKREKLIEDGLNQEVIERKYRMEERVQAENNIVGCADLVVASTQQEVKNQYGKYDHHSVPDYLVNPPGLDIKRFFPYYDEEHVDDMTKQARDTMQVELNRFFIMPDKPLILALSRPDKRKNVASLIQAFGESKELQAIANLAVFLGIRKDILTKEENERDVLIETLLLMDKYDLYGKIAVPKKHDFTHEVPELYRIAASRRGVFVNPALTEPFGLTLLESGACGLPIVATKDGGPEDIVKNCNNGILVDVSDPVNICEAIKKILINKELWKTYSRNGIDNVRSFYTWSAHIDRYMEKIVKLNSHSIEKRKSVTITDPVARRMIRLNKMIICDIDNTLTGDPESLKELTALLKKNSLHIGFGVATGRSIDSALQHLAENGVPIPDVMVTSVGSEIYYHSRNNRDNGWSRHINQKWNKETIRRLMATLPFVKPQDLETEREFKISYYMEPNKEHLAQIHDLLTQNRCRYQLIYSHQKFLDVLPQRASKGKAIRYLSYKWEIPLENFLVAGDSGNDEEMLRGEPHGVVVGNFSKEMDVLRGKRRVYFSPRKHAGGVIDGIYHYKFLER